MEASTSNGKALPAFEASPIPSHHPVSLRLCIFAMEVKARTVGSSNWRGARHGFNANDICPFSASSRETVSRKTATIDSVACMIAGVISSSMLRIPARTSDGSYCQGSSSRVNRLTSFVASDTLSALISTAFRGESVSCSNVRRIWAKL